MTFPTRVELSDHACHNQVWNGHREGTVYSNLPSANLVHIQQNGNSTDELANVYHPRENKRHIVILTELCEKCWSIVHERVDARSQRTINIKLASNYPQNSVCEIITCWKRGIAMATHVRLR